MRSRLRRLSPELALTGALLIVAASMTRLLGGGLGGTALGPLLLSAAIGALVPAALALRRVVVPVRLLSGTVAVALVSLWTSSPGSTTGGLPTARTWNVLEANLRTARPILVGFAVPLRPTQGVIFLASLLVGMVAVLASVLLRVDDHADRLTPALALACPFALLVFVAAHSVRPSLALPIGLFVVCCAAVISLSQPVPVGAPPGRRHPRWSSVAGLTLTIAIVASLVALGLEGAGGAVGSGPGGGAVAAVPPTGLSLTSSLVALEVHDANVVLFRARSTVPTYWQVAVLNVFRNGEWTTDTDTASALRGAAGGSGDRPQSVGATGIPATFATTVDVAHLSSRLLPVPPTTVAVSGPGAPVLSSVGALSARATEPGQRYTTTSLTPANDPGALAGDAGTSSYPPALVQAFTGLPPLPSSIGALARDATAGAQTPLGEAEALVDWFRSGRFTYSLDPPAPTPGVDPLVSFLTTTRTGTCEQFAGAFTMLARTLGLPTRMVVGFTAGRRTGPDEVTVRGDDAHAWPEVYLGPVAGWVSFEPTPQKLSGEAAPEGVVGPSGVETTVPPAVTTPPSVPLPSFPTTIPTVSSTAPTTAPPSGGSGTPATPAAHRSSGFPWLPAVLVAVGVVAVLLLVAGLRRRRWSPSRRSAVELALLSETIVDRALKDAGMERPRWQPLSLFVAGLSERLERRGTGGSPLQTDGVDALGPVFADAATVAAVVEQALYDFDPVGMESARRAYAAALRVNEGLRGRTPGPVIGAGLPAHP